MKKNGFTLIELIASVTILAMLALVAFPAILNALTKGQNDVDDSVKNIVEMAAQDYANDTSNFSNVSVCTLVKNGYITTTFYEKYKYNLAGASVSVSWSSSKYKYTFSPTGGDATCTY